MATQTTRWIPDTCDCILTYTWDDQESNDDRKHNINEFESKCGFHTQLDDSTNFDTVLAENQGKNKILGAIADEYPEVTKTDPEGNIILQDKAVMWSFDKDRKLIIDVPLLANNKAALDATLASVDVDIVVESK